MAWTVPLLSIFFYAYLMCLPTSAGDPPATPTTLQNQDTLQKDASPAPHKLPPEPTTVCQNIHSLRMVGKFDEALAVASAVPETMFDADLALECAWVYALKENWKQAAVMAEKARQLNPKLVEAWLITGIVCREQGDRPGAQRAFSQVCLLEPDHVVATFNLGRMAIDDKDWPGAIMCFDSVLKRNPKMGLAYYQRAIAYCGKNDLVAARRDLDTAIALVPSDPDPYLLRAEVNERCARCQAAADDAYIAIELGTKEVKAYLILARSAEVMSDWNAMKIAAGKAAALDKTSAKAWLLLGKAQRELGETDVALESLNQSISLDSKSATAYLERATLYIAIEKPELATADCTAALKQKPSAFCYALRAYALLKADKLNDAFDDANNAVTLDSREATGLLVRANINLQWKNLQAARKDAVRATKLAPTLLWGAMTLAEIELEAGNGKGAVQHASNAIALEPGSAAAYWLRGRGQRLAGDHAAAADDFRAAVVLDPSMLPMLEGELKTLSLPPDK